MIGIMNIYKTLIFSFALITLISCGNETQKNKQTTSSILVKVDSLDNAIKDKLTSFKWQLSLDHHRMAEKEGAYTPPAIVTIFSDSEINSKILENNDQLIALDLPFKVLAYSEPDTISVKLAYTSAEFIARRHDLTSNLLIDYSNRLDAVLSAVDKSVISETQTDEISIGFGIIKLKSDFDFNTTLKRLKETINSISDTKIFGEIDYQKDAEKTGIELNPTTLLLFGAPEPGAKAMVKAPKLGVDAFCQKLLVFENGNGEVWVALNDIIAFSKLYYDKATVPQRMINKRLEKTITSTIRK